MLGLYAVVFTVFSTFGATMDKVVHPTHKTLERYLESLCGAYTNMDKVRTKALQRVRTILEEKNLDAGKGSITVMDDERIFCLYVFQKPRGRLQAYTLTYNPKEKHSFVQSVTPSRAVQHVFDHHKDIAQGGIPYDHIQRPVTSLWSTHKKGPAIGIISSVALAQKVLSPQQEKTLGGRLGGLLQSSAWNNLVGARGMWFMDGHTFTLRVPAYFRKEKGYIDCTFVLKLERTGMYDVALTQEPFWRKS